MKGQRPLKVRKPGENPWCVEVTESFERAFSPHAAEYSVAFPLLDSLYDALEADPRTCGEPNPLVTDGTVWVWESPELVGIPDTFVAYTIEDDEKRVTLTHFASTGARSY